MATLDPDRWQAVSPYLDEALGITDHDERAAWLASLREQDPAMAADVQTLLEEHGALAEARFLEGGAMPPPRPPALAGETLGAYTLVSPLGQGGMGSVWLAKRSDGRFEGLAAVKLLNLSLIGRDGEARFRREGSVLARLQHPNIAHLIDAGVSPLGQPYLVLEHVDGEPIDRYCDAGPLGIDARIRLFQDVLTAVAFAHANLVVHRDLKPPNVLVGKEGRVKLLDFGIAKLLEPETGGDAATALTREGESALTPKYAAPEQLTGGPVTTATDVYALGVMLYVLLTGQHPAGPHAASAADLIKAVVETQALRPSDAVVSASSVPSQTLVETAARRSTHPRRLRRLLQGDLDNIVARTLKKEPGERYPSVESMAEDLRRHLDHRPVSARADSLAYRAAKFVRRNRTGVAAAALVIAAALTGVAAVAWQARETRIQRDVARTQLARATAANEFTSFLLSVAAPGDGRFNVSELLAQGETLIDKQFASDDALRAEMLVTVGEQYMLSERWDRATPILERAAALAARSSDPALKARAMCPLALLKISNADRHGAEAMIGRVLENLPDGPQYAEQRAECLTHQSEFGFFTGEAEPMIRNATAAIQLLDQSSIATSPKRIDAQAALAYGYYLARRNGEADRAYAQIMTALEQVGRDRTLAAADTLNNWALVYYLGDIAKAEPLARRVIELRRSIEGSNGVAPTFLYNYAGVLLALARYSEAQPILEETIRVAEARKEPRIQFDAMMRLAELHIETGDLARASAQLEKLTPFVNGPRFNPLRRALLSYDQGLLAEARGDRASARSRFAEAIATFDQGTQKLGINVLALIGLARTEQALGDGAAATTTAERALTLARSFVEKDSPSYLVGHSLAALGDVQRANGMTEAARASFKAAWEHLRQTLGPDHPATKSAQRSASS